MDMKKVEKMRVKEKKWVKMIHQWEKTGREPEELRKRIWKGCPNSLRLRLWPLLLRLKEIKEKAEQVQGPNIYEVSYNAWYFNQKQTCLLELLDRVRLQYFVLPLSL